MLNQDSRKLAISLERLAAQGASTAHIADAVISTWKAIDAALAPVIGAKGVCALDCRSLYLVRGPHPWLAAANEAAGPGMDLSLLEAALSGQESFGAASAAGDQLEALYVLLSSLIGPSLTGQLLHSAWNNPFGSTAAQDRRA